MAAWQMYLWSVSEHKFNSAVESEWEISLSPSPFLSGPLSLPLFCFPADTCRQAHTSREQTSEKCNLSISAPQREDKQCWKNEGINTRWIDAGQICLVPPIHKRPCHVPRTQVWKFKDKLDCARGRCCCFLDCLLVFPSSLFHRLAPPGMCVL